MPSIARHKLRMSFPASELLGPSGLIFIAGILGVTGAFLAAMKQAESERQLRAKNEEIVRKSEEIARKSEEISQKSEEIAELNKRIAASVTGGNSFCYYWLANIDSTANAAILMVFHEGEFPIYDLATRVVDLQQLQQKRRPLTYEDFFAGDVYLKPGTLAVNLNLVLKKFALDSSDRRDFRFYTSARNGMYIQELRLRRVHGKWRQATRVWIDEKVAFEKVPEDFPRPRDQLDWDNVKSKERILPTEPEEKTGS